MLVIHVGSNEIVERSGQANTNGKDVLHQVVVCSKYFIGHDFAEPCYTRSHYYVLVPRAV